MKKKYKFIYGPVPSRRLGISLGVSPIPHKTCNYSCVYCQLGRTNKMTNTRKAFYDYNSIIDEVKDYIQRDLYYDAITIVGEGEPTLYLDLKMLIKSLKNLTDKPIVVITNGALLYDKGTREALQEADIIMPTLDCYDQESFKAINRPHVDLDFDRVYNGIVEFSKNYKGRIWLETMLVKDYNDSKDSLMKMKKLIDGIKYEKLYINTPVRPPAEEYISLVDKDTLIMASEILNGICIDKLVSEGFYSNIKDDVQAVLSIIKRHPMNQFEIGAFVAGRKGNSELVLSKLNNNVNVDIISYKGYKTYRYKKEKK